MRKNAVMFVAAAFVAAVAAAQPLVRLDAQSHYRTAGAVVLRVSIDNADGPRCRPFLLSTVLSPTHSGPTTQVHFSVTNETTGKAVHPEGAPIDYPAPLAAEFFMLQCGTFYGGEFALFSPGWRFPLRKGRYSVRARVTGASPQYFREHPDLHRSVAQFHHITPAQTLRMLPEQTWESNRVTFDIDQ